MQINKDFECERYTYGWCLHHYTDSVTKKGDPRRACRTTYHGTLIQVCDHVLDRCAGDASGFQELRDIIADASDDLRLALA